MANLNDVLSAVEEKSLTREEEVKLGEIIQSENSSDILRRKAINTLVMRNIRLVLKFSYRYQRKEFEFEDIVGYGILGLFTAAKKFDPTRKIRFTSYARHWIKESMLKAIREYSGIPKIPVYLVKNLWGVARILVEKDCDNKKLSELVGISEQEVAYLRSLLFKVVQFDHTFSEADLRTPEDNYIEHERNDLIENALKNILSADEFQVIVSFYMLCGYPKFTFAEMEEKLGIKDPQYIKISAIKKLRENKVLKTLHGEL